MPRDPPNAYFSPQNTPSRTRLPPHRHRQPKQSPQKAKPSPVRRGHEDTMQDSPPESARALWGRSLFPPPFGSHRRFQPLIN